MGELSDWAIWSVAEQSAKEIGNRRREVAEGGSRRMGSWSEAAEQDWTLRDLKRQFNAGLYEDLHLAEIKGDT